MIKLFQIPLTADLARRVNAGEKVPAYDAYTDALSRGKFPGREWYVHVADIHTDDLDLAFEFGNIGPESKLTRWAGMHSVSVGDVLVANDIPFIVRSIGFEALYNWGEE